MQDAVRIIITRNPYLYRGLRMRVVNYSAVARYIQGEVQSAFGDEVDPNTIVTAIMRLSNQLIEPEEPRSPLAGSRLNLVTGISEVTIRAPPVKQPEIITKLLGLNVFDSYMTSLRQTPNCIRILTNSNDADRIRGGLGEYNVEVREGYAELHIKLPQNMEGVEGALTMVVNVLEQGGVYAVDAGISGNEISLVLGEEDASRAFEALRTLSR